MTDNLPQRVEEWLGPVDTYVFQVGTGKWTLLDEQDAEELRADPACRFMSLHIDAVAIVERLSPVVLTYHGILDERILTLLRETMRKGEEALTLEGIPF